MKDFFKNNSSRIFIFIYLSILVTGLTRFYFLNCVKTNALPTNCKSIVIDVGHGGWDPGKVVEQTNEKDINLKVSEKLLAYLEQGGCIVTTTRSTDTALAKNKRGDLKERVNIANADGNDMLISIHQNYYPKASVKGAQVFYFKNSEESKALAELIQKRLCELDNTNTRVAKANGEYYLLKESNIPAVIVECGFLSNPEEMERLNDKDYQNRLAWAIYLGVCDYYSRVDC